MKKSISKINLMFIALFVMAMSVSSLHAQEPLEPCTPDCEQTPFGPVEQYMVSMAPLDCAFTIHWTSRVACNSYYDVQIVKITTDGSECYVYQPLEKLFRSAYYKLITANPMGYPPLIPIPVPEEPGVVCNTQWRISQASCWTSYDVVVVGQPMTIIVPCLGSDCCLQPMSICRWYPEDYISIDPIGDPYPVDDCNAATPPPGLPEGADCSPICNWFQYEEGGIIESDPDEGSLHDINSNSIKQDAILNGGILNISINAKIAGNYTISITDPYGIYYKEINGACNVGNNEINIDLSDFPNGNYIYTINVDGNQLLSNKIILSK